MKRADNPAVPQLAVPRSIDERPGIVRLRELVELGLRTPNRAEELEARRVPLSPRVQQLLDYPMPPLPPAA